MLAFLLFFFSVCFSKHQYLFFFTMKLIYVHWYTLKFLIPLIHIGVSSLRLNLRIALPPQIKNKFNWLVMYCELRYAKTLLNFFPYFNINNNTGSHINISLASHSMLQAENQYRIEREKWLGERNWRGIL